LLKSFSTMPPSAQPATLRDVARFCALGVSTVSCALRETGRISPATVARVRAAADRLGYRKNARVAELMAAVRRGRGWAAGERLALVWVETGRGDASLEKSVSRGARERARERGYGLEEFRLEEAGGSPARMAGILEARGIAGVVFGPLFLAAKTEVAWPWGRFAMAVVGAAEWPVALSRAAHHHYEALRRALSGLAALGCRRPALVASRLTNERAHRGWEGAWHAYGPRGSARRLILVEEGVDPADVRERLERARADGVVAGDPWLAGIARREGLRTVVLSWSAGCGMPGIEQDYGTIAGHAVDLVVAQLQRNERGPPLPPRTLLFAGVWRDSGM
jgi:LacI family transcriptional regulator